MSSEDRQAKVPCPTLPQEAIDPAARDAVLALQRAGHTAYLVGGGVRDLLLGRRPKDFDIATNAPLAEVRRIFPRTRSIGRRFPIVHLQIGRSTFEVARFRKRVPPEDGGMRETLCCENSYGTPEDDALARDFTVNALFYDPGERRVIDLVGGMRDLDARVLRSVGDPSVWYYEDPVRILRAARFAGKLGFTLPEEERAAMRERAALLDVCPPQRVTEEVFKILECGGAGTAFAILFDTGVLEVLFPDLCRIVTATGGSRSRTVAVLRARDTQLRAHRGLPRDYLFVALNYAAARHVQNGNAFEGLKLPQDAPSGGRSPEGWLYDCSTRLQIPRAYRARQRTVMRLVAILLDEGRSRGLVRLSRQPVFPYLMALLRLHARCFEHIEDLYCRLRRVAVESGADIVPSRRPPPVVRPSEDADQPRRRLPPPPRRRRRRAAPNPGSA